MSKLYVFGIGGTGSRVLRALTMLLASGVKCDAEKIVPIIIDPDDSAADMCFGRGGLRKSGDGIWWFKPCGHVVSFPFGRC